MSGARGPRGRSSRRGPRRGPRPRRPVDLGLPEDSELDGELNDQMEASLQRGELEAKDIPELLKLADEAKVDDPEGLTRDELVTAILSAKAEEEGFLYR